VRGKVLQASAPDQLEALQDALIVIAADGVILSVEVAETTAVQRYRAAGLLVELTASQYLMPELIDTHIHAPQWPQTGTALDLPLEKWLYGYTFPLEAQYEDTGFAREVYGDLVATLLTNGATTGVYDGSLHLPETKILADLCLAKGQRAFIGKTAMDHPEQCPENYRDKSARMAIKETRDYIKYVKVTKGNEQRLIEPVITPRFIPSCTDELLEGLGKLA
jgi:guanine deaminase